MDRDQTSPAVPASHRETRHAEPPAPGVPGVPGEFLPPDWVDGYPPDGWYAGRPDDPGLIDGVGDDPTAGDEFWQWWGEGSGGDGPPEPQWALDASARVERELLAQAASGRPGGPSAHVLQRWCPDGSAAAPCSLDASGLLDGLAGLQRLINWAQAAQQRYLAALARPGVAAPLEDAVELASCPLGLARDVPDVPTASLLSDQAWGPAIRAAAIKLAAVTAGCALRLSPVAARARTERAVVMVDDLRDTLDAQQSGDLDGFRASIIAERTSVLTGDDRRVAERRVLPVAADRTPGRLRDLVDAQVTRLDPEAAAKRERNARRGRGVRVQPDQDGMATLRADLAGPDAQISFGVLDRIARTIQAAGLANGRGRSQIRADVFTDIFHTLGATGTVGIDQPGRPDRAGPNAHPTDGASRTATTAGAGVAQHDPAPEPAGTEFARADGGRTDSDCGGSRAPDGASAGPGDPVRDEDPAPADHSAPTNAQWAATPGDTDTAVPDAEVADTGTHSDTDAGTDAQTVVDEDECIVEVADPDADGDDAEARAAIWQAAADLVTASGARAGCPSSVHSGWVMPICVNVYVHASTLAGWDDLPGELDGHGIISADFARALAASAGSIRAIAIGPAPDQSGPPPGTGHSANPARARTCGTVLDAGRRTYRPPARTADYVTARDRACSAPGCRARAETCDLDHRQPWDEGGATCPCNLDILCRFHHAVKTFTAWQADPGPDGSITWTAPTRHRYLVEPGHVLLDSGTLDPAVLNHPGTSDPPTAGPPVATFAAHADDLDNPGGGRGDEPADDPPPF